MWNKFIKKSICYAFIFTALISLSTTLCCEKKMLRRHPVVLKETRNRADTKVSVTVEPEFILSQRCKTRHCVPSVVSEEMR